MSPLDTLADETRDSDATTAPAETASMSAGICRLTNLLEALARHHRELHRDTSAVTPIPNDSSTSADAGPA